MDWSGLLRDSWCTMRRASALWGLGVISALQAGVYGLIIMGLILPMTALTQMIVTANVASSSGDTSLSPFQAYLPQIVAWIQRWEPQLLGGILLVVALWVVLGIFDVAATGGLISQATCVADGRDASVGAGMRDGFAVWWRTIGLLAIAALPSLAYLLAIALFTLFTISIPLSQGQTPDLAAISLGNMINGLLSTVVSIAAIPLVVLVNLGLRYVVVEGKEWKAAFSSAWRLAKLNLAEVAVMYLIQVGITLAAGIVVWIALGVVAAVAGVAVAMLVASAQTFSGAAMFVTLIAGMIATAVFAAYSVGIIVWYSVVWTSFWRRLTGRNPRSASTTRTGEYASTPMYESSGSAYPWGAGGVGGGVSDAPYMQPPV